MVYLRLRPRPALVLPALPGRAAPGGRQACRAWINRPVQVPRQRSSFRAGRSRSCSPTSRARPGCWPARNDAYSGVLLDHRRISGQPSRMARGRGRHPGRRFFAAFAGTSDAVGCGLACSERWPRTCGPTARRSGSGWRSIPARPGSKARLRRDRGPSRGSDRGRGARRPSPPVRGRVDLTGPAARRRHARRARRASAQGPDRTERLFQLAIPG